MHGTCANLLLESIPCMKKAKRSCASQAQHPLCFADVVETMACINVMHGTLLKLYPLGAKTPTFQARVNLLARMLELTSSGAGTTTEKQVLFVQQHPSLMRICFMEYSINALEEWLPCERALLFPEGNHAMATYSSIAVAMCDIFRQDAIATGRESWHVLNGMAAVCIERCIRVCKFKLFRVPEPIVRGPHIQADSFLAECMGCRSFSARSMDLAMHLMGGDRDRAAKILSMQCNLQVFALPECVAVQQLESMDRIHSACSSKLAAAQRITFCSVCAINGKVRHIWQVKCLCFIFFACV